MDKFKVVEIFSSIEGEGIRSGYLTTFIRLHGCNLSCSYCDSSYACKGNEYTEMSFEEIYNKVQKFGNYRVTLTGGEPLLTEDAWRMANLLAIPGYEINIETNGSIALSESKHRNIFYTMDYKCPSSGMEEHMVIPNLEILMKTAEIDLPNVLKFVVGNSGDLNTMKKIIEGYNLLHKENIGAPKVEIFVSPVFGKIDMQQIVNFMKKNNMKNVRIQTQLHKQIWNPEMRGV